MRTLITACGLVVFGCLASVGCQDASNRRAEKPVIDTDPAEQAESAAEEAGESLSDAVDAVTPDESIVDINTPLGDVNVGRDPATGDTNVNVDSGRAKVDVSTGD